MNTLNFSLKFFSVEAGRASEHWRW